MRSVSSTQSSSAEYNGEYAAASPGFRSLLDARFAKAEAYDASPAHARDVRTQRIEDAVVACYNDFARTLKSVPTENLTQALYEKLRYHYDGYGLTAPPKLDTIRPVVYGKLR